MRKRVISLLLAIVVSVAAFAGLAANAGANGEYSDVSSDHWAYDYIKRCYAKDWFSGYPDGTFHPEGRITRAEAMKVFVVFLGLKLETVKQSTYYDVSATAWYAPYIEAGKDLFPKRSALDGQLKFQPDMPVTREDVMYGIVVSLGYDKDMEFVDQSILNMYSDVDSITTSVRPYIAKITSMGIVDGEDNKISAQDPLTRAQFAKLLAVASEYGVNDDGYNKRISSIDVYPSVLEEMLVGDSFEVMAIANYTDGTRESYSENTNPYVEGSGNVVTINKNKITAIGEGTVVVKFNNEELKDISLVISVKDMADAPVIRITDFTPNTTEAKTTIKGVITDKSGSAITLTCNGSKLMMNSDGTFSLPTDLSVGKNEFEFKAVNGSGKEGKYVVEITRTAPTPEPTAKPTAEPTAEPTPEPTVEPTQTPEPVYADDDPVQFAVKIIKKPTIDDRTVVVRVSYSGLTTAKVTEAKFVLGMDADNYTYDPGKSDMISGGSMRYQKLDKGVRFLYSDPDGCSDTSYVLADIAFDVDEAYDPDHVSIDDFKLNSVSLTNGTAHYNSSNISIK